MNYTTTDYGDDDSAKGPAVWYSWDPIGLDLSWCLLAQSILMLMSYPLRWIYSLDQYKSIKWLQRFSVDYLGKYGDPPREKWLLVILLVGQLICSGVNVYEWISSTYAPSQHLNEIARGQNIVTAVFFGLFYFANALSQEFSMGYFTSPDAVFDVLTITPLVTQLIYEETWLSLVFLRSWGIVKAYVRLDTLRVMNSFVSAITQGYIISVLKFVSFVFTLSSCMYIIEVLGDFSWMRDTFIEVEMGSISVFQMFYWLTPDTIARSFAAGGWLTGKEEEEMWPRMVTTVSTVGY
ncbi:hypothetical protein CYMTET_17799, partial [Cymbomonas tetramitiformis]